MSSFSDMRRYVRKLWAAASICAYILIVSVSCDVIQDDLELLVDDPLHPAHSPRWSSDGKSFYYILGSNNDEPDMEGNLWNLSLSDKSQSQVTDHVIRNLNISQDSRYIAIYEAYWFWTYDLNTWTVIDSIKPCEKALENPTFVFSPMFSYETDRLLYYSFRADDSIHINCIDLDEATDEGKIVVSAIWGRTYILAPGPGDSLLALGDTIYNLNTGGKIPTGIVPQSLHWNPVNPNELLICTGEYKQLKMYIFNAGTEETRKIKLNVSDNHTIIDGRFSPDGEIIILVTTWYGDGYAENQIWLFDPED